jgi:hypothetical protein
MKREVCSCGVGCPVCERRQKLCVLLMQSTHLTLDLFQHAKLGEISPEAATFQTALKGILLQGLDVMPPGPEKDALVDALLKADGGTQ